MINVRRVTPNILFFCIWLTTPALSLCVDNGQFVNWAIFHPVIQKVKTQPKPKGDNMLTAREEWFLEEQRSAKAGFSLTLFLQLPKSFILI